MSIKTSKEVLRRQMKQRMRIENEELRKGQPEKTKTLHETIAKNILMHPEVQRAQTVFVYVSFGAEAPTHLLIEKLLSLGKVVCVPKIIGEGQMVPVQIRRINNLRRSSMGFLEPVSSVPFERSLDVILVPGLAFDAVGHRLGRGGGYYDRFLSIYKKSHTIGLAWPWQIVPQVPIDKHDIFISELLTVDSNH